MTTGGRLAVACGCAALGAVATWLLFYRAPSAETRSSRTGTRIARTAAPKPVLWILAIGVSQYADPSLSLQFADADARAVAQAAQRQAESGLYAEVRSEVLTDAAVTRTSIIAGLERILASARRDDVVMLFLAGHGIRDRGGGYYFLPSLANAANLEREGMPMAELDDLAGALARAVRAVIILLDTCHAGALRLGTGGLAASDLSERMTGREGLFVLAAAQPGEESSEQVDLGHGSFSFALLQGLSGAADTNEDGLISASELFGYVAHQVPLLSGGRQHPYHKLEGGDLIVAAAAPTSAGSTAVAVTARPDNSVAVLEFRNLRADPAEDWMGEALRIAFNTELSKVRALRVYSPEAIDRAAPDDSDRLDAARRLGVRTLITGSFQIVGETIRVDAEILDTASGTQTGSDTVRGPLSSFFDLQKRLVLDLLRRLQVQVSAAEGESIETESNTSVDAFHLLLEAEGIVDPATPAAPAPTAGDATPPEPTSWLFASVAYAAENALPRSPGEGQGGGAAPADAQSQVRAMLESYRTALEHKDLNALAALYAAFPPRQREALASYLDNAGDLEVELSDVTVEAHDGSAEVSFLRRDRFLDKLSGKPVRVEVRLTKTVVQRGGRWVFAESK